MKSPFYSRELGNLYFIFLWDCKGSWFKCLVCLLLSWGSGPERLSKCALLISASALPICVICTITDYYENRKGSMLILPVMCLHVKHEAFTKKSLVYSAEGPNLQNFVQMAERLEHLSGKNECCSAPNPCFNPFTTYVKYIHSNRVMTTYRIGEWHSLRIIQLWLT